VRHFLCVLAAALTVLAAAFFCGGIRERAALETSAHAAGVRRAPDGKWILIELDRKRLTLYEGTEELKSYGISSGTWNTPSPIGTFRITNRFFTEMSGFGTRFLGLNVPWGQYGIHGTNKPGSIGQNASHGCIRLYVRDAEELYSLLSSGTKVVIEGGPYGALDHSLRELASGDRGSHVRAVQERLKALGFYAGTCDGVYGQGTSRAVKAARQALGLSARDKVDAALYAKLGLALFE
jgi:hypothetical protein